MRRMVFKLARAGKKGKNPVIGKVIFQGKTHKEVVRNARAFSKAKHIPFASNVSEGFYDATGFHPIRSSADYSPAKAGEGKSKKAKHSRATRATRKRAMGR
ncbi:MAG TPA: hypothetical protein VMQ76_05915 [Terracidiphilus sp.]|nr:hypothetical protein [Terracidiphilus sp.]